MKNIFCYTGNPFVDGGVSALQNYLRKNSPEEIDSAELGQVIETVVPVLLTENWRKRLHSVFPNSKLTNPSVKKPAEEHTELLNNLVKQFSPSGKGGSCMACGRREETVRLYKNNVPLTGSGDLLNFFPGATEGSGYCPVCAFSIQFLPLLLYACGNLVLIHSNSSKVNLYWSRKCLKNFQQQLLMKDFAGFMNEGYTNPRNALLHVAEDLIREHDENWVEEPVVITMFYFSNYGQGPALEIFKLPSTVFRFLARVKQLGESESWYKVLGRGYNPAKAKAGEDIDYRNTWNSVVQNLLDGKSIVGYFIDTSERQSICSWELLGYYLKEVKSMAQSRIDCIKRVADEIAEVVRENEKRLGQLERAKNYTGLRNILRLIAKDRIALRKDVPLFTLEEYVEQLFPPDGAYWWETRDLILFRLYEVLHDFLVQKPEVLPDEEESNEEG